MRRAPHVRVRTGGGLRTLLPIIAIGAVVAGATGAVAQVPHWDSPAATAAAAAETVYFRSADGHTQLVAYLSRPTGPGPFPAMVMLHGRAGPYSAAVSASCSWVGPHRSSPCNADTQSARARAWSAFWVAQGAIALHVDSYGPRGVAHGFGRYTHDAPERAAVNERTVRPLDAEGALAYLARRPDVRPHDIALQGWSNGASTALNALARQAAHGDDAPGFRFGLAFYPGCGPEAVTARPYASGAALTAFLGSDDEEVSPAVCRELLADAAAGNGQVHLVWYDGATHDFDDPGSARQSVPSNRQARQDAFVRAEAIARRAFGQPAPPCRNGVTHVACPAHPSNP